jgi:hypothetical protein
MLLGPIEVFYHRNHLLTMKGRMTNRVARKMPGGICRTTVLKTMAYHFEFFADIGSSNAYQGQGWVVKGQRLTPLATLIS